MSLRKNAAYTVGIGSLVAAAGALVGAPAVARTAAAPDTQQASVVIHPDVIQLGKTQRQVPTTAACEAAYEIACYRPAQIQQAYNLPALYSGGITGKGTTIAIVDSFGSPTIQHDLSVFDQTFGLPAPPSFQVIQPDGPVPALNPDSQQMDGWAGETTLDVEYAHTIAPGANILLVETPVAETEGVTGFPQIVHAENYVLAHYKVDVISQSFGVAEHTLPSLASVTSLRSAYLKAALQKVTVVSASGDNGATDTERDGQTLYTSPVTDWPASDPTVTAVGGAQLHLDANGNHVSPDTVWNDTYNVPTNQFVFGNNGPNPMASGGGKSVLFTRPVYQNSVQTVVGNTRGVPDISMSAACDGAVIIYQSFIRGQAGWDETCGTSEATPLFAGIVALADQKAGHPLGEINPVLYYMSQTRLPGIVPVTSGNNTVSFAQDGSSSTVQGYQAQAGYSLAAGVGTVNADLFVPELAHLSQFSLG